MAIMVDADVIIAGEKGKFDFPSWVASMPLERFEIAAITIAELWHGLARVSRPHKLSRQQYLEAVASTMPVLPYTEYTAYEHARIWAELQAGGNLIGYYDVIVAATAMERSSTLATFNHKHFSKVKGLPLIYPA